MKTVVGHESNYQFPLDATQREWLLTLECELAKNDTEVNEDLEWDTFYPLFLSIFLSCEYSPDTDLMERNNNPIDHYLSICSLRPNGDFDHKLSQHIAAFEYISRSCMVEHAFTLAKARGVPDQPSALTPFVLFTFTLLSC